MSDVSKHIVRQWSSFGVEVQSSGDDNTTVTLPPRFEDIGTFCDDLWEKLGATVDLEYDSGAMKAVICHGRQARQTTSYIPYYILVVFIAIGYTFVSRRDDLRSDAHTILVWLLSLL